MLFFGLESSFNLEWLLFVAYDWLLFDIDTGARVFFGKVEGNMEFNTVCFGLLFFDKKGFILFDLFTQNIKYLQIKKIIEI